ncbi:nitrogenase iron-molybdenum cofactor biosynthesis protein NifN [Oscillatoria sp. FACHB-1406]|uniref:nitrogenase iron-molybdenum cofactor biosynthesis protein NifN n=1 Tax=Oscillatoria sp. FACHB-1406 TaxID=2692846 RepID=UPI00168594CF|nr:nitrogenase iron-molybdenum cofactor biosynthesis protein NifN [Oscillatoria sp. FACHB-1406]MBD2577791.1 nitrogenase iron-molybdenum cofactor biosynthesis protein NifN [Oscillatoria sp. FACHB-1406]
MTAILATRKPVAINPLKVSSPLGASLAFLGLKGTIPLFHGSQGCTAFSKVLLVRHFREAIPLSTTAMMEVSTILGGEDNVEQAILTLVEKAKPEIIGLLTTGLTETRGDDMKGILRSLRQAHPELDSLPIVFVSTPDYKGALQEGYAATVAQIVAGDYGKATQEGTTAPQVTILAGSLLGAGDVAEIKQFVASFGFNAIAVPDLSGSLDGHLADEFSATTTDGTTLEELRNLSNSSFTLAIGESLRPAAEILEQKFGTPYEVFPRLMGLEATDRFAWKLAQIASMQGRIPSSCDRARRQLQDAMLDTHFYFSRKRISLALEPDLLYQTSWLLHEMGAEIQAAVTTTASPLLEDLPVDSVTVGDLDDLENLAPGSDLLIANSNAKSIAKTLDIPLYRMGYPIFDRLGNGQRYWVGYRGTMQFLFDLGNIFLEREEAHSLYH